MGIENLKIDRKELPIKSNYENNVAAFQVPVYPRFLDEDIELNTDIIDESFCDAVDFWWEDLNQYYSGIVDKELVGEWGDLKSYKSIEAGKKEKRWIDRVFLKDGKPEIEEDFPYKKVGRWKNESKTLDNGFASYLSIDRNHGGTLFLESSQDVSFLGPPFIKFSDSKLKEYSAKTMDDSFYGYIYSQHNVDQVPGALFLRAWAVMYLNKALEELAETGQL